MQTYSVDKDEKGYSFVKGNTKFLKAMTQEELAILAKNGDPRVIVNEAEIEAVQAVAEETPSEGQNDEAPAGKSRRSSRNSSEAEQPA